VYLLVHTNEVKLKNWQITKIEMMQKDKANKESEAKESGILKYLQGGVHLIPYLVQKKLEWRYFSNTTQMLLV